MAPPDCTRRTVDIPGARHTATDTTPSPARRMPISGVGSDPAGGLGMAVPPLDFATLPGLLGEMVVIVAGEIDLGTGPALLAYLHRAMRHPSCRTLIVDLQQVRFLGARGISVLITIARTAQARDVQLILVADHRAVLRPLQLTGTDDLFTLVPTLDAARRA